MNTAVDAFFVCLFYCLHILIAWLYTLILIRLLHKYLLIFYCVSDDLGAGDVVMKNRDKNSCPF